MMNKALSGLGIACFFLFASAIVHADDSAKVKSARNLLQFWATAKYDDYLKQCDEKMKAAMGADKLASAWASLEFQHGKYLGVKSAEEIPAGEYTAIRLSAEFERSIAKIRFVLDKNDKLTGLWFDAVEAKPDFREPPYAPKSKIAEEKLTVKCGDYELPAILTRPAGDGNNWPAVVFVHGSGPHDADETIGPNKVFRDFAWGLAANGVASLRYEKRTKKYGPTAKPEQITLEWEVLDDAVAAAELLRSQKGIDARRIFVAGHSLGGFSTPFIAQRDAKLAGILMFAANARPIVDLVEEQLAYLAKFDGGISADEQNELDKHNAIIAAIRSGSLEGAKEALLGAPNAYWLELNQRDNVKAAEELKLPILILQGTRDYQVTLKDLEIWQKRLGGKPNVTIKKLDKLNHLFMAGEGPSGPQEYQKPGFVDELAVKTAVDWVKQTR